MEATMKKQIRSLRTKSALVLSVPALVWLLMQGYKLSWTGLSARTLWDWMDLLLMPLFLVGCALLVNRSERDTERTRSEERSALEHEIETDRQQEEALQAYFDRMIELVLKEKLSKFSPDEMRNVARVRTMSVLRGLDGRRKGLVVLFLRDSGLIDREAVVDMSGADLSGAFLAFASLKRVNLSEADLSKADLRKADLSKSYLSATNLSGAHLRGANLNGVDLFEANLNGADLSQSDLRGANLNGADLRGSRLNEADIRAADMSGVNLNVSDLVGANLRGTKLGGAKLLGANLREADLSQADLSGTQITETEWEKARSLEGATMPDGSKHE